MLVHLRTTASITATLVTLDGVTLASPRPILLSLTDPLILYPGQRAGVQLCSDDPAAAAAAGGSLFVRAPLKQFGTLTSNSNGLGLDGPGSIVDIAAAVVTFGGDVPSKTATREPLPPPAPLNAVVLNNAPYEEIIASSLVNAVWGRPPVDVPGHTLAPVAQPPPPATVTVPILLSTGFLSSTSAQYFYFNNITFSPPSQPAILQSALSPVGVPPNAAPDTAGYNVLKFPYSAVVDLVIYNTDTGDHPLHVRVFGAEMSLRERVFACVVGFA